MASIVVDSELMTNYVSAVPAPAGSHHVTVLDENRMPMLFCMSSDRQPRLRVICKDINGHSDMIDIHDALGLPADAELEAFHLEQSWSLKLFLCVAYKSASSSSQLLVAQPFSPETLKARSAIPKVSGGKALGTVQKIFMSPISGVNNDVKYPDIFLVHRNLSQSASWGSDITHIRVDRLFTFWDATNELETPENTSAILDIAPAVNPYGQGMYVLYVSQGVTKIYGRFIRPDPNATDGATFTFVTNVQCPKGARAISTILNEKGYSCLLVAAAAGIQYLTVSEATSKDKPGKTIFDSDMFKNAKELSIVQDRTAVTLWLQTAKDELAYIRTDTTNLSGLAVSSLLLPSGQVTAFAPVVSRATAATGNCVRQMVVTNDKSGNLSLLEQTSDVGLWRRSPFYAPSQTVATELKSYTVSLKVRNANSQPLARGSVFLSASSTLCVIINGRYTLLTQVPTWYECDETGSLDFIVPSESLGSQVFRMESVKTQDDDILDFQEMFYDPAAKPMAVLAEKLSSIESGDDLAKLTTSSGRPLLSDAIKKDKKLLGGAQKCLKAVSQAYTQLPDNGSSALGKTDTAEAATALKAGQKDTEGGAGLVLDGWHWITEMIDDVTDWVVETAGAAWTFVCKIGGVVKKFVLDCVEKICEAASWVWDKLKVAWDTITDFIGFVFNWDDIMATKRSLSTFLNAGFGCVNLKIDGLMDSVDEFFDGIESTIDDFGDKFKTNKQLDSKQGSAQKDQKKGGTSASWAAERLKNGGAATQTKTETNGAKPSDKASNFFAQEVAPAVMKLQSEFSKVGTEIFEAFKDGSIGIDTIMSASTTVLKTGVVAVRTIIKGLLTLVKTLVSALVTLGNAEIHIPIFSWVNKKFSTAGLGFSLFDAISLIIAIPMTIVAKAVTGRAPPRIENLNAELVRKCIDGDESVPKHIARDWAIFTAELTLGITAVVGVFGFIKVFYKMVTAPLNKFDDVLGELDSGPGSFFSIMGIVFDMINCIVSVPKNRYLPGAGWRIAKSTVSFARGAYHTLVYFSKNKSKYEEMVLCLDLLTTLANMAFSMGIGKAEHDAAEEWAEYDESTTNTEMISAGLDAVSGVCYYTAAMTKSTNPDICAGAAALMTGVIAGTGVLKIIQFDRQYEENKRICVGAPPSL